MSQDEQSRLHTHGNEPRWAKQTPHTREWAKMSKADSTHTGMSQDEQSRLHTHGNEPRWAKQTPHTGEWAKISKADSTHTRMSQDQQSRLQTHGNEPIWAKQTPDTREWAKMLTKGKQFLFPIWHLPFYSYSQVRQKTCWWCRNENIYVKGKKAISVWENVTMCNKLLMWCTSKQQLTRLCLWNMCLSVCQFMSIWT